MTANTEYGDAPMSHTTTHTHTTERFFLDTEFIEDGTTIELLSIAVVTEDGGELYAENADADLSRASDWVRANVLPHLTGEGMTRREIAAWLIDFVAASDTNHPEFWAYYGDYDWVAVCQLFGTMMDLPKHWPMFCMDVKQLCVSVGDPRLPAQSATEHHALADAHWTLDAWRFLTERVPPRPACRTCSNSGASMGPPAHGADPTITSRSTASCSSPAPGLG